MAQDTLDASEEVVAELSDGTRLVRFEDSGGAVLEAWDDPDTDAEIDYHRTDYDRYKNALLHFALWFRTDGFKRPERSSYEFVPTEVVAEGKDCVAAWIFLNGGSGFPGSRRVVADKLGITENTVSRYLSRVRSDVLED